MGWRLGLQAVTGVLFITFLLGTFYRSASLYHPQRRAILHLKTQKRKIKNKDKEKNKLQDDTPPFFDFSTLKSRTVQIILMSVSLTHFGIYTPLFLIVSSLTNLFTLSIITLRSYMKLIASILLPTLSMHYIRAYIAKFCTQGKIRFYWVVILTNSF